MIIRIHQLKAQTILGIHPEELETLREVVIDLELQVNAQAVTTSQDISDTIDYAAISEHLVNWLSTQKTGLIEVLVTRLLAQIPSHPYLEQATITLHKPGCVVGAEGVSVTEKRDFPSHLQKNLL